MLFKIPTALASVSSLTTCALCQVRCRAKLKLIYESITRWRSTLICGERKSNAHHTAFACAELLPPPPRLYRCRNRLSRSVFQHFLLQERLLPQLPPTEPHPPQLPADGEGERGEENGSRGKKTRLLGKQTPVLLLWRPSLNSFPHSCVKKREDARVLCVLSHEINKNFFFFNIAVLFFIANTYTKDSLKTVQIHGEIKIERRRVLWYGGEKWRRSHRSEGGWFLCKSHDRKRKEKKWLKTCNRGDNVQSFQPEQRNK